MKQDEGVNPADGFAEEPEIDVVHSSPTVPRVLDSSRPTWLRVLTLAWPVLVQQLLLMAVGLYDLFLAGNNAPEDASLQVPYQAAQTTANYLAWSVASFSTLVSVGSTALVARFVGAGDRKSAVHTTNQSILLAVVIGAVTTVVGLLSLPHVVRLMGMDGAAAGMAAEFMVPVLALVAFQMVESAGLACLVGAGDTRPTLWVLGGVAVLNIPMAWVCFHGLGSIPAIGFPGIALGTSLSHAAGGVAVLVMLARGRAGLKLNLLDLRPDGPLLRRVLRISIPAMLDTLSIALCQLWFLRMVNQLGVVAAAAHGIAIRWESLGYLSGHAFATAAAAIVGQNLGAKRLHEAARAGWITWAIGVGVMCLMGGVFFGLAPQMFELLCPAEHQQQVIEEGVPVLRLVAFAMPPLACIIIFTGALRGAGDTRVPMVLSWIGFLVVRIPLAYVLMFPSVPLGPLGVVPGFGMGLYGAWLAMFADLSIRGLLFLGRFAQGGWKRIKV